MSVATMPLSQRLSGETAAEHDVAENSGYMTKLIGGQLSLTEYANYLSQFARVYRAIEARPSDPRDMPAVNDPRLHRLAAIEADLRALGVNDWRSTDELASTRRYVERIEAVSDDPPRFLAHHYLRYLGDLSGGQIIARMLSRHYNARPDHLSFYRFDGIDSPVRYKRAYRAQLDALHLSEDEADAVVAEAQATFGLNSDIFAELSS